MEFQFIVKTLRLSLESGLSPSYTVAEIDPIRADPRDDPDLRFVSLARRQGIDIKPTRLQREGPSSGRPGEQASETSLELATRRLETQTIEKESLWCVKSRLPRYRHWF